ncbi:serine hydrolase domain-containing protein [Aquimarina sp. 2201CG5-10]|uniref:serine hydrolase domain-containing protein n=1 Tax=Aquimarina callyspongiae TaxID=3098150 RepID=UPI002AB4B7DB|nr:serine hydrolase domain-containing protein [Aquimarina sp. 2201CG5-10]MDY8135382.1 serine hydrolase domain-containing protein [Aquimarina sp. 2201CG5-10]
MRSLFVFIISLVLFLSCSKEEKKKQQFNPTEKFTSELIELKEYFQIPGLAISIEKSQKNIYQKYLGVSDIEKQVKLDSTVLFPIASITKVFSGVLVLRLVEQGKLSLEDPINKYLTESTLLDSIKIKHVLSHTSQGKIGENFYYSSRFGLLTNVIEKASGQSFATAMNEEILVPLGLKNTFLLKDSAQITEKKRILAKPYVFNNKIENGFIDSGYSSSAGIVSNLEDLSAFNKAIDDNKLISEKSKKLIFSSIKKGLPYGYGIFNQELNGVKIVWAYGQYDCYSSLFLKVPSKNITLTILANNNLMSDAARLIYGDASSSLFVLSFLKNYVFEYKDMDLFEKEDSITSFDLSTNEFYRKKILAEALAESFMARFYSEKVQSSSRLLERVFSEDPNYLKYANLNLLHNLSFLKDVSFYKELGEFNKFDSQIENIGNKLISIDPENPYLHIYLGTYYSRKGDIKKAKFHFENIVNTANFSKNWYTQEAQDWLNDNN